MGCALFVPRQNMFDAGNIMQHIVNTDRCAAGISKKHLDIFFCKTANKNFCAGHRFGRLFLVYLCRSHDEIPLFVVHFCSTLFIFQHSAGVRTRHKMCVPAQPAALNFLFKWWKRGKPRFYFFIV